MADRGDCNVTKTIFLPLSIVIIFASLAAGFYCANFTRHPIYRIAILTMPSYAFGIILLVFCLLPDPPSIFGFHISP